MEETDLMEKISRPKCTANAKSTGNRCGKYAILGGTVCRIHGGSAPQVIEAAHRRNLENLVGPAIAALKWIVETPFVRDSVKLAAAKDILDRNGFKAPTYVEGHLTIEMVEKEIARLEALEALEGNGEK